METHKVKRLWALTSVTLSGYGFYKSVKRFLATWRETNV